MFSSFTNLVKPCGRANIPVRIPNDDTTFKHKEYPNVIFTAKGSMSGKVTLVHGGSETDETGLGLISTRIWVTRESDKENVVIRPSFDNKTHTFFLEAPNNWGPNSIYHETLIQYPRSTTSVESLTVEAPATSLTGTHLQNLLFGNIQTALTNASISLEDVRTDTARLHTSNGNINGTFDAGHIELVSSNGSIRAKINIRDALDGEQSKAIIKTTNGSFDLHATATETSRGLWMRNSTSNGNLVLGAVLGKADRASFIGATTTNARIDFSLDASQTGQPLEIENRSSNGSITSSTMVPVNQHCRGSAESSNSSVNVNLTEEFQGRFEVETSNASTTVQGTELTMQQDKKTSKRGYRIHEGPSEFKVRTSNSSASLSFYPSGHSLAADSKY
ncbi:hypothetical protein BGZ54_003291 [Gamsiella multidivaricata]|nr:hypothetical protein BGZ54_003291 [Gamsiella multidivaricata]